ncbi:tail fiber domain-containing protein, partial [Candidatus Dojkabacteria bacterium]|nr:tail fiber domain-containing protein [Candidatus Dojkabacteria bacterium]
DGAVSMQGDFAIGTTTPAFKLDVRQNTASTHIGNFYSSTDNYGLTIGRRSAASTGVATHIAANDATGYGIIQAYNYDSVGGGAVPLSIQASGGDVGIGTSVPGHKLDVTDRMRVRSGAGGTAGIWFSDSSAANRAFFGLSDDDATPVAGIYNAGWRLNVDSAGHVGVGTTAPDEYLHVEQDQPTFKITSTNALSTSSGTEKIANIDFEGQNNNVYRVSGRIAFRQDGTWSTSTDTISPTAFEVYLQDSSASDNFSIPVLKIDRNEIVTAPGIYNNLMFASVRDVQVDSSGNLGFISSSIRYKENVVNMENIDWLYNLRPVNYNYKVDSAKQKQYGLIAEEVDQINPYFVSYNKEGLPETVNYSFFISPIIQALIDQKNEIDTVKTDIENIKLQLISTSGTSNGTTPLEYSDYLEVISLKVTGLVAFGADTVGTEAIPAGETEVSVNFSESYSTPPIVTGTGASDLILTEQINFIITDITETEFIIKLNNAATEDIEINWHAFEKAI